MTRATRAEGSTSEVDQPDLPTHRLPRTARALWQVAVAVAVGTAVAVAVTLGTSIGVAHGGLLGWDLATLTYLTWVWGTSWRLDAEGTAEAADREDPTRAVTDVVLLTAAVISLLAVANALADASRSSGLNQSLLLSLGIGSITSSWFLVHTLFTMSYAREYFVGPDGGIDFNMERPPVWSDFAYLAFTVGMTFQVSDTELQTSLLRRIALRHMLLSYLFGAVIVAVAINLVAGLTK
jgi:uncharacterized membrane protein